MRILSVILITITFVVAGCVTTPIPKDDYLAVARDHIANEDWDAAYRFIEDVPESDREEAKALIQRYPKLIKAGLFTFSEASLNSSIYQYGVFDSYDIETKRLSLFKLYASDDMYNQAVAQVQNRYFYRPKNKFDAIEMENFVGKGPRTIEGQAFLRQRGGGVVTCAGQEVALIPATHYMTEIIYAIGAKTKTYKDIYNNPIKGKGYGRHTICDAQGTFQFINVPDESWYVVTIVQWKVGSSLQGALLYKRIEKSDENRVLLSDGNVLNDMPISRLIPFVNR
jgi:hypothetical protein